MTPIRYLVGKEAGTWGGGPHLNYYSSGSALFGGSAFKISKQARAARVISTRLVLDARGAWNFVNSNSAKGQLHLFAVKGKS